MVALTRSKSYLKKKNVKTLINYIKIKQVVISRQTFFRIRIQPKKLRSRFGNFSFSFLLLETPTCNPTTQKSLYCTFFTLVFRK